MAELNQGENTCTPGGETGPADLRNSLELQRLEMQHELAMKELEMWEREREMERQLRERERG